MYLDDVSGSAIETYPALVDELKMSLDNTNQATGYLQVCCQPAKTLPASGSF